VPFDELLQYAKNISKYTVPPTYREHIPTHPVADEGKEPEAHLIEPASNGVNTPAQGPSKEDEQGEGDADVPKEVTAEEAEWLKKLHENNQQWQPWPHNDKIRRSNLMQIQYLLDTKQDPNQVDATQMGREEKEKIVAEAAKQAAAQLPAEVSQPAPAPAPAPAAMARRPEEETQKFEGFGFTDDD